MLVYQVAREGGVESTCYSASVGHYTFTVYVTVLEDKSKVDLYCYLGDPSASPLREEFHTTIPVVAVNMAVQAFLEREKRLYTEKMDNLLSSVCEVEPLSYHFKAKTEGEETIFTCIRGFGKIKKGHWIKVKPGWTTTSQFCTDKYHYPWEFPITNYNPWITLERYIRDETFWSNYLNKE